MNHTGLQINKYIKRWLQSDSQLTELVPAKNMAPLVLSPTSYPFISWTHDTIEPEYTKDGCITDHVDELIVIVSDDYEQAVEIAARIREKLEYQRFEDDFISIPCITLAAAQEDNIKDAFVQSLVFSFDITNK